VLAVRKLDGQTVVAASSGRTQVGGPCAVLVKQVVGQGPLHVRMLVASMFMLLSYSFCRGRGRERSAGPCSVLRSVGPKGLRS
jgi:hypothetical protein